MFRFRHFLVLVFLLNCGALCSVAQRTPSNVDRRFEEFQKQSDKSVHDEMEKEMKSPKLSKKEALAEAARLKTEIREDLEGLQLGYNSAVLKLRDGSELDSEFVRDTAEKIHKHAVRFRSNIKLPKPEVSNEVDPSRPQVASVRAELKELCSNIYVLLTSSMVENPNVIDLSKAESMRQALESIVSISDRLRENRK